MYINIFINKYILYVHMCVNIYYYFSTYNTIKYNFILIFEIIAYLK